MNRKLKINKEEAKALYIEGIKELDAHSKRDYIDKNLERGSKYPSVSFMAQRFNISFNECRELAGIEKKSKWTKEELKDLIKVLGEKYGYDKLTHEMVKEKVGVHLGSEIKRAFGYPFTELKERLKNERSKSC